MTGRAKTAACVNRSILKWLPLIAGHVFEWLTLMTGHNSRKLL